MSMITYKSDTFYYQYSYFWRQIAEVWPYYDHHFVKKWKNYLPTIFQRKIG